MVIGAFPAFKLVALFIRQISKPLSNAIRDRAKSHEKFRKYICMPPAQLYNRIEVTAKMWTLNLGKPINIPPLKEDTAIELGAHILGELIFFGIGAIILILEVSRQSRNDARKQEALAKERARVEEEIRQMEFHIEKQDLQIAEMTRALEELGRPVYRVPEVIPKSETILNHPPKALTNC